MKVKENSGFGCQKLAFSPTGCRKYPKTAIKIFLRVLDAANRGKKAAIQPTKPVNVNTPANESTRFKVGGLWLTEIAFSTLFNTLNKV